VKKETNMIWDFFFVSEND